MELPKLRKVDPNKPKKKKILLLSDDIRMFSGIATQGKEMVLGTVDKYDWVQIAGSIKHPEKGKVVDISQDAIKETGVEDASVILYPTDGYGSQELVREIMIREEPDMIIHFTDPRFWGWLYQMEHEIRQQIPLVYLNIWDDLPDPKWNEQFYRSCDMLMAISKQTYGINRRILDDYEDWQVNYVPHGIGQTKNYPVEKGTEEFEEMMAYKKQLFGEKEYDYILFLNNRNIRRKNISDIILAYKSFCDGLSEEEADRCLLYLHTSAIDNNGTDLPAVVENVCPDYNVAISNGHVGSKELRWLYNIADTSINLASNEGFGLTTCESLMNGTPIIVNVTGGLQDQCGFKLNGKPLTAEDYVEIGSLHDINKWKPMLGKELTHGPWVEPVWSKTRSLKGSVPTPFIFDDTVAYEDVVPSLEYFYTLGREKRKELGKQGHEWVCSDESGMNSKSLSDNYKKCFETTFENFKPRNRFVLEKVSYKDRMTKLNLVNPQSRVQKSTQTVEIDSPMINLPKLKKIK